MISNGVVIYGAQISNSVIFSKTQIGSLTKVINAVVFPDVSIGKNCIIKKCIIDSGVTIPSGMTIGVDHQQDVENGFRITEKGVVLVTRDMIKNLNKIKY